MNHTAELCTAAGSRTQDSSDLRQALEREIRHQQHLAVNALNSAARKLLLAAQAMRTDVATSGHVVAEMLSVSIAVSQATRAAAVLTGMNTAISRVKPPADDRL